MAVLAAQDWHLPTREPAMDLNSPSIPRQRSSPANDHPTQSATQQQQQPPQQTTTTTTTTPQQQGQQPLQQPYSYPLQQQPQGSWTPSIAAQPFYPSFYQNALQQQQYPIHSPQPSIPQQNPYFDPAANAHLAQWAYQQMMFNAQQAHQMHMSPLAQSQRGGQAEYFPQAPLTAPFNSFPSGTPPPPHQNHHSNNYQGARAGPDQNGAPQYNGFHPYRRPNRQPQRATDNDWRAPNHQGPPQPPYARNDASDSTSSLISGSSHNPSPPRSRTNSTQSVHSANGHSSSGRSHPNGAPGNARSRSNVPPALTGIQSNGVHGRTGSTSSSAGPSSATTPTSRHHRNQSSSSSSSSATRASPSTAATTTSTTTGLPVPRPARPSPLSQGTFTAAEKRMSRDDSDLAAMRDPTPTASMLRGGGLKGRLRRALAFNNAAEALDEDSDDDKSIKASSSRPKSPFGKSSSSSITVSKSGDSEDTHDPDSPVTLQPKKKSRAASLFNARMNVSTDNISLSSTVSSASVMIRKLGSIGKLARRNSLAGITSLFKDKKDRENGEGSNTGRKGKKNGKGEASEASVSHVTAELDRSGGDWSVGNEMSGLSPAAKLARQHTLKSNAEAAAKAKAQQEAAAAAAAAAASSQTPPNGAAMPTAWEKNTTTRQGSPVKRVEVRINEDGTKVLVEDDEMASDDSAGGHYGHSGGHPGEGWEEEEPWGEDDESMTIRIGLERTTVHDDDGEAVTEQWAVDIRRSIERTRQPAKGILKNAAMYDQHAYLTDVHAPLVRARSNSYNSPAQSSELGPLARIPSPDPDHIDGLHRHPSHSSNHSNPSYSTSHTSTAPTLPPLSFDSSVTLDSPLTSPQHSPDLSNPLQPHPPPKSFFNLPNSSAPALSTMSNSMPPPLAHRSATTPAKRLAFASNLSVYDTFSASVYDRRSEPATWSRLTPALAQRIKEELNSYKMEEMEVHAASRIHTQFFV